MLLATTTAGDRVCVCVCGGAGGRGAAALPAGAAAAVRVRGAEGQAGAVHVQVQGPHRGHVAGQGDRRGRARRAPRHRHTQVSTLLCTICLCNKHCVFANAAVCIS